MKSLLIALITSLVILLSQNLFGQFKSVFKYGNVIYYKIDKLKTEFPTGSNSIFDREIQNRFIDIYKSTDSINVIINDASCKLFQKMTREPKEKKEKAFYRFKPLLSNNMKITTLRLLSINDTHIEAEAKIKVSKKIFKIKERVFIPLNEIQGIYIGNGKKARTIIHCVAISSGLFLVILLLK